jgi:hypothetical protein
MHNNSESVIKQHMMLAHSTSLTRAIVVANTSIIRRENDFKILEISEAIIIKQEYPDLNRQDTGKQRSLKLRGEQRPQNTLQIPTQHNFPVEIPNVGNEAFKAPEVGSITTTTSISNLIDIKRGRYILRSHSRRQRDGDYNIDHRPQHQ